AADVATVGVAEVLGEMSLVDTAASAATVRAITPVTVLALAKTELQHRIDADPAFGCRFYRALAIFLWDRLREARRPHARQDQIEQSEHGQPLAGELDGNVLDTLTEAGARFDRILKALM